MPSAEPLFSRPQAAGGDFLMKLILAISVSVVIGLIAGVAGTTYFFIYMEGSTQHTTKLDRTFEAADLDNYRAKIEEMNAIEACKEKLLDGS